MLAQIARHRDALVRRRFQLVREDDYGKLVEKGWRKEIRYFLEQVVAPELGRGKRRHVTLHLQRFEDLVADRVATAAAGESRRLRRMGGLKPLQFEEQCRETLVGLGWEARLTAVTGDQGADIIARNGDLSVVLQCKKLGGSVGNAAVQEVTAARHHYRCTFAAVVADQDYTPAARQLAATNRVHLLHVADLGRLERILRRARQAADTGHA